MDDILVHGRDKKEREEKHQSILRILKNAGLKLNEKKCSLRQKQLNYLGHCLTVKASGWTPQKVCITTELQPPSDEPGLQRFLGMVHYLGQFLPNLSDMVKPLNDLLKCEAVWTYGAAQGDASNKVKQLISTAPTYNSECRCKQLRAGWRTATETY